MTVRRSVRYNEATHKHEIGSTKRKKVRIVDFGNALADILKKARKQQLKNRMQYGELYHRNFYREVTEKNRLHYEYYNLPMTEDAPDDYTEISFVCPREDGCLELPATVETAWPDSGKESTGVRGFPLPHIKAYLHDEPVIKRGTAQRRAGIFRAFRRKHNHECLCTRHKGGEAGFRKAIG